MLLALLLVPQVRAKQALPSVPAINVQTQASTPQISPPAPPPCLEEAAQFHQINGWVLRAILWRESRNKPTAINRNSNGSIDVGIGQINSVHFETLAKYGIAPQHLMDACVGTYVAAWHLARQVKVYGNTWAAVGAYGSRTPHLRDKYALDVYDRLRTWAILP